LLCVLAGVLGCAKDERALALDRMIDERLAQEAGCRCK
jgi:hypothetical protein